MTVTWLDFVNNSLKRVRVIQGDAGELATSTVTSTATGLTATEAFTDSSRQTQVDLMLQVGNEVIHEMFSMGLLPREAGTATITLTSNTREYALPTDFERFAGKTWEQRVFRGATNGMLVYEYPGGYAQMLADQPVASDYRGDPSFYAISPTSALMLRFDRDAATGQNGNTYNTLYEKRIGFSSTQATESLPFSDTVADSLVPVAAEEWTRAMRKEADPVRLRQSLGKALSYARMTQPRDRWGTRRGR